MRNIRKLFAMMILMVMFTCAFKTANFCAEQEISMYTSLLQKSNGIDGAVSHKVVIKKDTITVYGSLSDFEGEHITDFGKHIYKLSGKAKYYTSGGDAPNQKMPKKEFKKYLKECKDSGLALILEFKNGKVVKMYISS